MGEPAKNRRFGLVGKNISYSFSQGYFSEKFKRESIPNASYENFDLATILEIEQVYKTPDLAGLNVTIPYKEAILTRLDELSDVAKAIGAVNTIQFDGQRRIGHNTDVVGFRQSLEPLLQKQHQKALLLGTGGAAKAVQFVLKQLGIEVLVVSRNPRQGQISYAELSMEIIQEYLIIVNCTPLGTYPKIEECPDIPYDLIGSEHLLYDLIYNPSQTRFLQLGRARGARVKNGLEMLEKQAEAAWEIWNQ